VDSSHTLRDHHRGIRRGVVSRSATWQPAYHQPVALTAKCSLMDVAAFVAPIMFVVATAASTRFRPFFGRRRGSLFTAPPRHGGITYFFFHQQGFDPSIPSVRDALPCCFFLIERVRSVHRAVAAIAFSVASPPPCCCSYRDGRGAAHARKWWENRDDRDRRECERARFNARRPAESFDRECWQHVVSRGTGAMSCAGTIPGLRGWVRLDIIHTRCS
jgi:hypothetical protein